VKVGGSSWTSDKCCLAAISSGYWWLAAGRREGALRASLAWKVIRKALTNGITAKG
jgi:hypothetical protein